MTKILALSVAVLCALPGLARAQEAVSPERQLANGWVKLASGSPAEALQIGDDLMRQNLLVHRALQLAVTAEVQLGRVDHALDRYERWMTPRRPEDVYLLAEIALGRLRELAASTDPQVQAEAAALLAQERLTPVGGPAPAAASGPAIDAALARAGDVDAAMRLTDRLSQPMGAEATFVLQAIGDARVRNAAPGVRTLLASPDPAIRAVAAQALGKVGGTEDVPRLRELAKDRFPFVQASATVALSQLGDAGAREGVDALLRSGAGELRLMAAEALGMAEVTRWSPAVTELLTNENLLVRVQAALLLSRAGVDVPGAQNTLIQAMGGDNPILREQAAAAFSEGPGADPLLLRKMLRDADGRVVLRGVRGLLALVR
jgi:HEAT repeat protein